MKSRQENLMLQGNRETAIPIDIRKRWFYSFASCPFECIYDAYPKVELLTSLHERGVDLYTFVHREFLRNSSDMEYRFHRETENYAIMTIVSHNDWWKNTIKKKERQSIKKAERTGVTVRRTEVNDNFLKGVQKIYNETPFREGRRYSGYGQSIKTLREKFKEIGDSDILGAYFNGDLIGLLWITYGDRAAMFRSFVSLLRHRDKCPNNALISEAVRRCAERHFRFLVYGNHYGFIPSLDRFRKHQGFRKFPLPRYYIPITATGQVAIGLGLHRPIQYSLSAHTERALLPIYSYASRIVPSAIWYQLGGE